MAEVEEVEDAVGVDADGAAVVVAAAPGVLLLLVVEHALLGVGDARHPHFLSLSLWGSQGCVCASVRALPLV